MSNLDDSDFEDIGGTHNDENHVESENSTNDNVSTEARTNRNGKKVRGKDIEWKESDSFDSAEEFHNSELIKVIKNEYSQSKGSRLLLSIRVTGI